MRYFKQPLPERQHLRDQTPGDFAVVARRAELLGENNPDRLFGWLKAEAELRGTCTKSRGSAAISLAPMTRLEVTL